MKLNLSDYPEILHSLRREIAKAIREEAEGEPEIVRRFAERVAAAIEAGLRLD